LPELCRQDRNDANNKNKVKSWSQRDTVTYLYNNELRRLSYLHHLVLHDRFQKIPNSHSSLRFTKMMSNASTTVMTLSRPIGIAKPIRWGEKLSQAPLAGLTRSSQKQLVKRMEDDGDDLVIWQWKPRKLVSAPFSRLRSRRVLCHPLAAAAHIAAPLALAQQLAQPKRP
jgi:hypothetical protein